MKKIIFVTIILFCINLFSQTTDMDKSFKEKISNLKIVKKNNVSDKSFYKGQYIFKEATKKGLKTVIDYMNLATALSYLKEDKNLIQYAVNKAFYLDTEMVIGYYKVLKNINSVEYNKKLKWFPSIKDSLLNFEAKEKTQPKVKKDSFNIDIYCKKNKLNLFLVKSIYSIHTNDQKYRGKDYKTNLAKKNKLDSLNLSKIDSLYKRYHTYIGKSLVGEKFDYVMWVVIQHSNIKKMEEYLPIILKAVKKKETNLTTLKMLIDRIHTTKYGNQIFGSQMGVDLAKEKVRKKIIAKYDIDSLEKL